MARLLLAGTIAAREPSAPAVPSDAGRTGGVAARLMAIAVDPFRSFMRRPSWLMILAFVALFKLGDALASALLGPFALDLGLDKETVAAVSKGVGLASVLAGGFVGGALGRIVPLVTGLWIAGLAQMLSNLAFTALALIGPATWALTAAVAIESFCGGVGTVLFVAFLSQLCSDRAHTATQYARCSRRWRRSAGHSSLPPPAMLPSPSAGRCSSASPASQHCPAWCCCGGSPASAFSALSRAGRRWRVSRRSRGSYG